MPDRGDDLFQANIGTHAMVVLMMMMMVMMRMMLMMVMLVVMLVMMMVTMMSNIGTHAIVDEGDDHLVMQLL